MVANYLLSRELDHHGAQDTLKFILLHRALQELLIIPAPVYRAPAVVSTWYTLPPVLPNGGN